MSEEVKKEDEKPDDPKEDEDKSSESRLLKELEDEAPKTFPQIVSSDRSASVGDDEAKMIRCHREECHGPC